MESAVAAAEVTVAEKALDVLSARDEVDRLFDEVPAMREFVGEYHARIEKLERKFGSNAKLHAKLNKLSHAFAEFRNKLGRV